MLATPGPVPTQPGWAYEFKWDGIRAIADIARGRLRLTSRNFKDMTCSYPELATLADLVGSRRLVLDGEIITIDPADGTPSFARLQHRMHVGRPSQDLLTRFPAQLYLFDVLEIDGQAVIDEPYRRRRELLVGLDLTSDVVQTPPAFAGDDTSGRDILAVAADSKLEGVVAKRLLSPYRPGQRSPTWVKTPLDKVTEAVVVGWRPGKGRRQGMIGSVLLGALDEQGRLVYIGHVGTGFSQQALREVEAELALLARNTSPLGVPAPRECQRDARWVEPVLVCDVQYRTLSPDCRLRHPSWRGLRRDREPSQVTVPG